MIDSTTSHPTKIYRRKSQKMCERGHGRESHEDIVVFDVFEGDGAGIQVDEGDQVDEDTIHSHALGASLGGEAFDRVEGLERSIGKGIDDVEEEIGSEGTLTDRELCNSIFGVLRPLGGQSTVDGQHDSADKCTDDEDLAARHAISERNTGEGPNAGSDRVDQVEDELHVGVITDGLVDGQVEVSETVSGELTEDTHESDHQESPASLVGPEELGVVPPALIGGIELNGLFEFVPFKLNDRVVLDSVSVVLGQEGLGLLITTVGEEPARRFGQEINGEDDNASGEALEDEGKAPRKVRLDLLGTEGYSGSCNQRS
jgi:hypothetical protein